MAQADQDIAITKSLGNPLGKAMVRVTGTRLGRFVEFDFSINDADLTVELVMPFDAFEQFCRDQSAVLLPPAEAAQTELEQLAWRNRRPGLYRAPTAPNEA